MTVEMMARTRRRSSMARSSGSVLAFLASASLALVFGAGAQGASAATRGPAGGTLPTTGTTGPLKAYTHILLPVAGAPPPATEAPNGAVFVAQVTDSGHTVVWVVDGDGAPAVAEHVSGIVRALAADADNLYVATYSDITAFSRQSGNQVGLWALPRFSTANTSDADLVSLSAWHGQLQVSIVMGNNVDVYRLNSGSSAAPKLVAEGNSAVFGPSGSVYFVRSDHHLVGLSASDKTTVGPVMADRPKVLGSDVQFVDAVAGGVVWVIAPAGQGLDAAFSSYNATTLRPIAQWNGVDTGQIVDTQAGALALGEDGWKDCPQTSQLSTSCVYRISSKGALSDSLHVGQGAGLLGPYPAVMAYSNTGMQIFLERLS
jgi:hypothetical protein